jgi:DNA-binding NtrC family response regulator
MEKILLIEDDDSLREAVSAILERDGYSVDAFPDGESGLTAFNRTNYECILSDFKLPQMNGLAVLEAVRERTRAVPFVIMTAFGSIDIAVRAMKFGANDFISKPFEPEALSAVVRDVITHRRIVHRSVGSALRRDRRFLSDSANTKDLLHKAKKVARVDTSVLILGESGTGKELVARFIHEQGPRNLKPFIAVNCAAIPADLLESELFGHEAGAFTGATQTRIGIFELAAEGTIFLDEIGDMPPALQVKLLRVLQEREVKRVGGTKTIRVNPRILAATNHDIESALKNRTFREDLYFRIAVVTLTIPPLRERPDDIELLTRHYTESFCSAIGRATIEVDAAAKAVLHNYPWPGNARELENVIERAVIMAEQRILPEHLGITLSAGTTPISPGSYSLQETASRAAREAEIDLIVKVLAETGGNKTKAAQKLGVSYKTLLNKIRDYRLEEKASREPLDLRDQSTPVSEIVK